MNDAKKRILILDDSPMYPVNILLPKLSAYDVQFVRDPEQAHELLEVKKERYHLVILDILMDQPAPSALRQYVAAVDSGLKRNRLRPDDSAQAVGLWLWSKRYDLRQPYGYLSSFPRLWMSGLAADGGDVEFIGADKFEITRLVCERGTEGEPAEFVEKIVAIWEARGWIASTGSAANQASTTP